MVFFRISAEDINSVINPGARSAPNNRFPCDPHPGDLLFGPSMAKFPKLLKHIQVGFQRIYPA